MENPNERPEGGEGRRDPFRDLQARVEAAIEEVRPKIKRAFEELDAKVDAAVADLKPRAQTAMKDVQPKVDQFVADVQPRLDSLLERLAAKIEDLRRDLDTRAARRSQPDLPIGELPASGTQTGEASPGPGAEGRDPNAGGT